MEGDLLILKEFLEFLVVLILGKIKINLSFCTNACSCAIRGVALARLSLVPI